MATRVVKRSCCGRGGRKAPPKDFCGSLKVSSGVTLIESGGAWSINVNHSGKQKSLAQALAANSCSPKMTSVKLAQTVIYALQLAVAAHKGTELRQKEGRQMPLILLKEFLFKVVGKCTGCRGRGCSACNNMGVA